MPARVLRRVGLLKPQVFLHIGAMKTGTTYLQTLMSENQAELAAAGFLFPGERWHDQSRAVRDVLGFSTEDPRRAAETTGKWQVLREQLLAHRGPASIVSMEFLSFADETQAARIVDSLAPAKVHVVLTVRDAATAIPTQWQTTCRNGKKVPFARFLKGVAQLLDDEAASDKGARMLRRTQWIPRMLDTWVPLLGADHVHVITVPPRTADPQLLWRRFAEVVEVPPQICAHPPSDSNPGLGLPSTELLRRVNAELNDISTYDYERVVKRRLAREVLSTRKPLEPSITLNRRGYRLAARWNRRVLRAVDEHAVELVGDSADLPTGPPPAEAPQALPTPSQDQLLEAAATGRDGMRRWLHQLEVALRTGDPQVAIDPVDLSAHHGTLGATPVDRWAQGSQEPVDAAVAELCDLVRDAVRSYRAVRALGAGPAESDD